MRPLCILLLCFVPATNAGAEQKPVLLLPFKSLAATLSRRLEASQPASFAGWQQYLEASRSALFAAGGQRDGANSVNGLLDLSAEFERESSEMLLEFHPAASAAAPAAPNAADTEKKIQVVGSQSIERDTHEVEKQQDTSELLSKLLVEKLPQLIQHQPLAQQQQLLQLLQPKQTLAPAATSTTNLQLAKQHHQEQPLQKAWPSNSINSVKTLNMQRTDQPPMPQQGMSTIKLDQVPSLWQQRWQPPAPPQHKALGPGALADNKLQQWLHKESTPWHRDGFMISHLQRLTAIKELLAAWQKLSAGHSSWLMYGSLLGSYRDGLIIPWDEDADVAMKQSDFERFKSTMSPQKLASLAGKEFVLTFGDRVIGQESATTEWGTPFSRRDNWIPGRLIHKPTGCYLDIFGGWRDDVIPGKLVMATTKQDSGKKDPCPVTRSWHSPDPKMECFVVVKAMVEPLQRCELEGMQFYCPHNTENFLHKTVADNLAPNHKWDDATQRFQKIDLPPLPPAKKGFLH